MTLSLAATFELAICSASHLLITFAAAESMALIAALSLSLLATAICDTTLFCFNKEGGPQGRGDVNITASSSTCVSFGLKKEDCLFATDNTKSDDGKPSHNVLWQLSDKESC